MKRPVLLDPVPLVFPDDGSAIRIEGTRLMLDVVVRAFQCGATAEEIVQDYPPVSLPDVYAVIAYYLRHRSEVEEYLAQRARDHAELRRQIEVRPEYQELRERLLAHENRARSDCDELRPEYQRSDLGAIDRGKYAQRLGEASNVVVLEPQVAKAFPNDDAVNTALRGLLELAQSSVRLPEPPPQGAAKRPRRS